MAVGRYPFRDYTNKVIKTTVRTVQKYSNNTNRTLYSAYKEIAKILEPLLQQEIDTAMAGRNWGEGRQMGGSFGGNGTAKVYVARPGSPITVSWEGQNILYIEYGTGHVGVENPYKGQKMIEGYAPEDHGWVFRNVYTEGWEPIAPFYKFRLKLRRNAVIPPAQLSRIVVTCLNQHRSQFIGILSKLPSESSMTVTFKLR